MIKLLMVDDDKEVLAGLNAFFRRTGSFIIIGEATDGLKAIHLSRKLHPDVVLMDITMPTLNGIDATRKIVSENPGIKVIVLSMHSEWTYVEKMFDAGAVGYLLKENIAEEMEKAINTVIKNRIFISKNIKDNSEMLVRERLSKKQKCV